MVPWELKKKYGQMNMLVTQHGLGRLLCLNSQKVFSFYRILKPISSLNSLNGTEEKYSLVMNLTLKEIF